MTAAQNKAFAIKIDEIVTLAHSVLLEKAPAYPQRVRAGEAIPLARSQAREAALHGTSGLARVQAASAFDRRWPDDKTYSAAHDRWMAVNDLKVSPTATKPTAPLANLAAGDTAPGARAARPAVETFSGRAEVEAIAKAAGVPFATKLAEILKTFEESKVGDHAQEFAIQHAGRAITILVSSTRAFFRTPIKPLIRTVAVSCEWAIAKDKLVEGHLALVRNAMREDDPVIADRRIRELGAAAGFETKVYHPNGELATR